MRTNQVADASSVERLLEVHQLLKQRKFEEARKLLSGARTPEETNALGVCLLRLGKFQEATQLFRNLVLPGGGILPTSGVPAGYRLNFATALLGEGNYEGFLSFLNDVSPNDHPEAKRLHEAHAHWLRSISLGRKWLWRLGILQPVRWPALPTPAGTLDIYGGLGDRP